MATTAFTKFQTDTKTALEGTVALAAAAIPTKDAGGLYSPSSTYATATQTVQFWALGYYYQTGFDTFKTACIGDATCDWNTWTGYDGMLFVVKWTQMSASVALGYYAICFPNPIGTSGGNVTTSIINTGFNSKAALLPQSCLGLALTVPLQATNTNSSTTVAYYRAAAAPTAAVTTAQPFYFINNPGAADTTTTMATSQRLDSSGVTANVTATHTWGYALWDDCYKLIGAASTGYYMNALSANVWSIQPPFCFGFESGAKSLAGVIGQLTAYTFVPTTLAVKLTSTPIQLGTALGNFNSITTWTYTTASLTTSSALTGTSGAGTGLIMVAQNGATLSTTPAYKTSVVYPTATVAKGASSLAMSLAAATVLATLF